MVFIRNWAIVVLVFGGVMAAGWISIEMGLGREWPDWAVTLLYGGVLLIGVMGLRWVWARLWQRQG